MDTKKDSEPHLTRLSRFQLLPAEIRQMIYDYIWSDWLGGQRVGIQLVQCDASRQMGPLQNITDQKHPLNKSSRQEQTAQKPTPAYKLTSTQLVRDREPDLGRKIFVLQDKLGDQLLLVDHDYVAVNMDEDEDEEEIEIFPLSAGLLFCCKSIYK